MAHTPGPWTVIVDNDHAARMALVSTGGEMAIDATRSGKNYAQDCANARLIAAAPELYEALQKIASCESRAPGDVVDIARAALAKVSA